MRSVLTKLNEIAVLVSFEDSLEERRRVFKSWPLWRHHVCRGGNPGWVEIRRLRKADEQSANLPMMTLADYERWMKNGNGDI
jgi:hypothetical protein